MSTRIDWRSEIDASVAQLPDRPAAEYTLIGRRALKRRRLTAGIAGLALMLVCGGMAWAAMSEGPAPRLESPVASDPTKASTEDGSLTQEEQRAAAAPWAPNEAPARVLPSGELQIRHGAVVHERREDLYPDKDTQSVALDLTFDDKRWWVLLEWDEGGEAGAFDAPGGMADSFDEFVADNIAGGGMFDAPTGEFEDEFPYAGLVNYTPDGLIVRAGVEVVRRVDDPISANGAKDSIGLVVEHDGATTWMLLEVSPSGSSSGTTEDATESGWPTFDLWLAENVALQQRQHRLTLAILTENGTMEPGEEGVQILDQDANPDIPEFVDDSASVSGVAMVSWQGETWFVLAARYDGETATGTFAASKADNAQTIESFLSFARDHYDEGRAR